MAGSSISISGINKSYKNVKVLKDVSVDIKQGDFLTILGPSGAGKTTLLKMIAGFEEPESGSIIIDDENILSKPIHKRNIGMLFQNYALFPHMTVFDNVAYPLKIRKINKEQIEKQVMEILQYVKLAEYAKRFPRQLSGGQQQRVALARAIVFHPKVLLLDEPLGALDKQLRKQMQLEIKRMHEELGLTTISVTHDQEEALTMSTKVCVMRDGRIEQIASPEKIYSKPINVFVATFIGEANVIPCKVVKAEEIKKTIRLFGDEIEIDEKDYFMIEDGEINVIIRPEKFFIVPEDYDGIKVSGVAKNIIYIGDTLKIDFQVDSGESISMKIFTTADENIKTGDHIYVSYSPKDVVLRPY